MRLFQHPTVRTHAPQLMKFILSGGCGSVIALATLTLFTRVLSILPEVAFFLSACIGALTVFFLNKFFTFKNREARLGKQFVKFLTVYGPAIVANFFLSTTLYWLGLADLLAQAVAIGVIAMWNYLMSHHYVFKKHDERV